MIEALTAEHDEDVERELADVHALSVALEKLELEGSLHAFVKAAWHLVEPSQKFTDNWHIEKLCRKLERVYHRRIKRLIINVPPGTAKSLIVNVMFPVWVWAKDARKRFLFASYGQHLSMRDNLRARQVLESPWFKERWPDLKLAEDQNAKGRYLTSVRGWRVATSVGGVGTGEHPDFIIIDDPTSAMQAESETERTGANVWFDVTVSTRLGRNPAIIVIMQRLNKDDLSGHLLPRGGWTHVRWPMRFEKCTCPTDTSGPLTLEQLCPLHKADPDWVPDPDDPRTEPGELLFPALFPEEKVKDLELNLGAYGAAGQLQQRPSPVGGKIFQRAWFQFVDKAPDAAMMRQSRGWDTAASEGKGDYTASVKCGELFEDVLIPAHGTARAYRERKSTGKFFLMDPIAEQFGPAAVDALIRATAERDGKSVAQREEKEGGAAGKTVIEARRKSLRGYNYEGVQVSGSKTTRARAFRAECEANNVYLVGSPAMWEAYIRQLADFTGDGSGHDDYVDASSCAYNSVLLEEPPKKTSIVWGH